MQYGLQRSWTPVHIYRRDVTIDENLVDIDGVIPQVASMEGTPSPSQDTCNSPPPGLLPDSLYVHEIIQDTPAFMLVDTGASVTAVSSSLFAKISPPVHLDPAPLPYIRTVSGEHLPVHSLFPTFRIVFNH